MMSKIKSFVILLFLTLLLVVIVFFVSIRFVSKAEDGWVCDNGQWVKHGNPSTEVPKTPCLPDTSAVSNPATSTTGTAETTTPIVHMNETRLVRPAGGEVLSSPYTINGTMPGSWFFEATARMELYDSSGYMLASGPVQAVSDWMVEGPVEFTGRLEFSKPSTATGTLVLRNDNPSGLPENEKKEVYPVIFGATVKVYFGNDNLNPEMMDCTLVYAVIRPVTNTVTIGRAAVEELLKGPTETEIAGGYRTQINMGVKINKLTIENGTAKVDFDKQIEKGMGGSCRVSAIRSQIETTLKQFPTVKNVIISVDGEVDEALQP
jgi:Sporulation and spore germination/Immunoglobulin-like domain of bacterial spore germination